MRTPFTGVGTALVTPFTRSGEPRRSGGASSRAPADRRGRAFSLSLRHDRREPDADGRRAAADRGDRRRRSERPGAGPGRRRRLRHEGSHAPGERDAEGRRVGTAVGDAVLQQADAGRPVSALSRDRRSTPRCRSSSTTCRAAPASTSRRRRSCASPPIPNIVGVKEASGNVTQMCEICRAVPPDFLVLSGDDALTLPLMAVGGRGIISVAGERDSGGDGADGRSGRAERLRRRARDPRADPAADAGQLRRVESDSGEGRDGGDGADRGDLPAADGAAAGQLEGEDSQGAEGARACSKARWCSASDRSKTDINASGRRRRGRRSRRGARRVRPAARGAVGRPGARRRTRRLEPPSAGASTPGSSRASCSASGSATSSTRRWITAGCRSTTRTRCR